VHFYDIITAKNVETGIPLIKGYWSLELIFLDKISANQSFGDIIEISQFVELAFSLRARCAKTCLYAYTPSNISDTRGPKPKWKNYLLLGFMLKLAEILT
jgi:hypothetical protein